MPRRLQPTVTTSTSSEAILGALERLAENKDGWVRRPAARRAQLLDECIARTLRVAPEWVLCACRAKSIGFDSALAGEEWLGGPVATIRNMRLLADALRSDGQPRIPRVMDRSDGRRVARVYPQVAWEGMLLPGWRADVWMPPDAALTQGAIYRDKMRGRFGPGRVCAILGAGNIASIGPMDALTKLFVEDQVVLIKTNPVNAYLQPFWEEAFRPLVDEGYLAVVRGGAEVGKHLVHHPLIDTVHITGSHLTHDAIVWGDSPDEQRRRKERGQPLLQKPISSELGAVTPVLVVPGHWSSSDLRFAARSVAGMVAHNASFNCNAAKALLLARGWRQRNAFIAELGSALERMPPRNAYYPGAQSRYEAFLQHYPNARVVGRRTRNVVPWTLLPSVAPLKHEYALSHEAFCGVLALVDLDARGPVDFLDQAVHVANDACWGTLSCGLLVDGDTEAHYAKALDEALTRLRYGGIAINTWPGMVFGLATPAWGAYPGHTLENIQSGRGFVHNTMLIDQVEKSVLRTPFRQWPAPFWFPDNPVGDRLAQQLMEFEARPKAGKLPRFVQTALQGWWQERAR